jgi:hypothetical protein
MTDRFMAQDRQQKMQRRMQQRGISIAGLIMILALLGLVAVLVAKVVPTFVEYRSITRAIVSAKAAGATVREIQAAFDKQRDVSYIDSISSKDLEITKDGNEIEVSFEYQKKIPLFGPASLLMEYSGTTANSSGKKPKESKE